MRNARWHSSIPHLSAASQFRPMPARVLVADDDRDVLEALRLLLKGEGYEVETVTSPAGVAQAVTARDFDALLMDMNYTRDTTGGAEGLDLLTRLQGLDATLPVVVMTAWCSIEGAIESVRRGARDYRSEEHTSELQSR